VLDLSLHGDSEEDEEVHDEDGPEDGHVEDGEEGADHGDEYSLRAAVPELELGEAADEGPELLRVGRRQLRSVLVVRIISVYRWINFRRQKGNEQIQMINSKSIRDYVPTLKQKDSHEIQYIESCCEHPSSSYIWHSFVKPGLINS